MSLQCTVLCIAFGKISKEILLGNIDSFAPLPLPQSCTKIFFEGKDFSQTSFLVVEGDGAAVEIASKPFPFPHAFIDTQWKALDAFEDGWCIYDQGAQTFFDQGEDLVRKESEKMDSVKDLVLLIDAFDGHAGFACRFIEEVLSECFPKCNMQILLSLGAEAKEGKFNSSVALTVALTNELCGNVQSEVPLQYAELARTLNGKNKNELYERALAFYESVM